MSNIQKIENIRQLVAKSETDFNELAKIHGAVSFKREASFAIQAMEKNSYLMEVANANPASVRNAVINVAAIGLSLSPVHKLAYLVPRNKEVCLDISYMGLVQLALACGIVDAVHSVIIREKDKFKLNGLGKEPLHDYDPNSEDRGKIVGVYCTALDKKGIYHVAHMKISDVYKIRDRSEGYKAFKNGRIKSTPWETDEEEMIKKTAIKRGYKMWPMPNTNESKRFAEAIDVTNSADPIDLNQTVETSAVKVVDLTEKIEAIKRALVVIERTEDKYLAHLSKMCRREIKSLNDLTESEIDAASSELDQIISNKNKKASSPPPKDETFKELDQKLGITNENT